MTRKTILVVDDAPENIDLLVGLLKDTYKVKAALNGQVALSIARSLSPPDLILLDIVMPDMDGLEVCKILKGDERTSAIPIVFLSGQASGDECDLGIEIGGEAYLQKPVEPESLFSILEIVIP